MTEVNLEDEEPMLTSEVEHDTDTQRSKKELLTALMDEFEEDEEEEDDDEEEDDE